MKRGMANIVFHPHGWIRSDQMVAVIDHAIDRWGKKVRFLNFSECVARLTKNLLAGQPLRAKDGADNGVRLMDLDDDGYLDVVIGNATLRQTRLWRPESGGWSESPFPVLIVTLPTANGTSRGAMPFSRDAGVRFGVLAGDGAASFLVRNEKQAGVWHFRKGQWQHDRAMLTGLVLDGEPVMTARREWIRAFVCAIWMRDGICEVIVSNPRQNAVFAWNVATGRWVSQPFGLPEDALLVDEKGRDAGLRLVDVNEDGHTDMLVLR